MKRVIKKYSNRRLYDPASSKTITLLELAEMVQQGLDIQVVDQSTGEDITDLTLTQALLELIRDRKEVEAFPLLLKELIRAGRSSVIEFVKNSLVASIEAIALTERRARELVQDLVDRGKIGQSEAKELTKLLVDVTRERNAILEERIKEIANSVAKEVTERANRELEEKLKEDIRSVLKGLGIEKKGDIEGKITVAVREVIEELKIPKREEIEKFKKDLYEIKDKLDVIIKTLRQERGI